MAREGRYNGTEIISEDIIGWKCSRISERYQSKDLRVTTILKKYSQKWDMSNWKHRKLEAKISKTFKTSRGRKTLTSKEHQLNWQIISQQQQWKIRTHWNAISKVLKDYCHVIPNVNWIPNKYTLQERRWNQDILG